MLSRVITISSVRSSAIHRTSPIHADKTDVCCMITKPIINHGES